MKKLKLQLQDATTQNARISSVNERPLFMQNGNRRFSTTTETEQISAFRSALPQFLAVSVKNILLFVYGMTLGFPTVVIPAIQGGEGRENYDDDIVLNKEQISWFSSINLICVPLGCLISGPITQPIGKRRSMQLVNIPILASWLLFHFATSTEHLYAALCLSGLSGGLMEAPVLTYVAEITEPKYRGILSALGSTCVITGAFVQFILGSLTDWRTIAAISSAFPIICMVALCFVPESPTWLIREHRFHEAIKSLQWLRGWVSEQRIEAEFNRLYDELITQPAAELAAEEATGNPISSGCGHRLRMWRKRSFLMPFFLVSFTFFTGHFSGKTPLQTYAVQIFHTLKAPINKYHATILLGVAELIATILCVVLIHFTGKRPLVFISTIGVGVCFFATATYAHYLKLIPGFAVNNIVTNVSYTLPQDNIITQQNITHLFESEEQALLDGTLPKLEINNNTLYNSKQKKRQIDKNLLYNILNSSNTTNGTAVDDTTDDITLSDLSTLDYADQIRQVITTTLPAWLIDEDTASGEESLLVSYKTTTTPATTPEITTVINEQRHSNKSIANDKLPSTDEVTNELLLPVPKQTRNNLAWLPMMLVLGAAFFSHCGIRMIPWILIGEVYPASIRSTASGLSGAAGYIFGFLANKLFLQMLATLTLPGTFWLYSSVAFLGFVVLYFILPETEGHSLAEIEAHFSKKSELNLLSKSSKEKHLADISRISELNEKKNVLQMHTLDSLQVPITPYTESKILHLQQSDLVPGQTNLAFEGNNTTHL